MSNTSEPRGQLLSAVQHLDLMLTQVKERFKLFYPVKDETLYNSGNYPGGIFTCMEHDVERLKRRTKEDMK